MFRARARIIPSKPKDNKYKEGEEKLVRENVQIN
jgi:hypothetical protein